MLYNKAIIRAAKCRPFSSSHIKAAVSPVLRRIIVAIATVWLLSGLPVNNARANPYLELDTFSYVEPVSINSMQHKWGSGFSRGNDALTFNRFELGFTYQGFGIGLIKRYDYALEFSKDTSEFFYLIDNKLDLPVGRQYDLSLTVKHTFSEGIRINRSFSINEQLTANFAVAYLRGLRLTQGKLTGSATVIGDKDYDFDFFVDYAYSEDVLFDRNVDEPDGQGYSFDLKLDWQIDNVTNAQLQVQDLFAKMYWNNAPVTTATATSDTKQYDSDGYVIYNPTLSGYEKYENYTQRLPPKITAGLAREFRRDYSLLFRGRFYETRDFYQLGAQYQLASGTKSVAMVNALYMLDVDALTLGFQNNYFNCSLTSDSLHFDKTHIFSLQLQFYLAL